MENLNHHCSLSIGTHLYQQSNTSFSSWYWYTFNLLQNLWSMHKQFGILYVIVINLIGNRVSVNLKRFDMVFVGNKAMLNDIYIYEKNIQALKMTGLLFIQHFKKYSFKLSESTKFTNFCVNVMYRSCIELRYFRFSILKQGYKQLS